MNKFIISIDGPAGSGKCKIAKYISRKYNLFHLDSGILYRRFALNILNNNISYNDEEQIKKLIKSTKNISSRNHKSLRTEKISKLTSLIAKSDLIRNFIDKNQKLIVNKKLKKYKGSVVDGRDIGSKVFKNAKIKLFVVVNSEIRAKRRHKQLIEQGEKSIYTRILKEILLRDKADINRKSSPLIVPKRAIIIDNSYSFSKEMGALAGQCCGRPPRT